METRRKLFTKENFCEGNRQKWLIVFLIYLSVIMGLDAAHFLKDVTPYLTFLTFLAGAFILGYSGTETMKLFRANSVEETQNIDTNTNINEYQKKDININQQILTNNAKENDYHISEVEV